MNNATAHKGFLRTRKIILTSTIADLAQARARADELASAEGCDVEVDVPGQLAAHRAFARRSA